MRVRGYYIRVLLLLMMMVLWAGMPGVSYVLAQDSIGLIIAIDSKDSAAVREQLESGIDPDDAFVPEGLAFAGASALHVAVLNNNTEIVSILLEDGANINIKARDPFHGTPLDWAAYWGIEEMVVLLVQNGADVNSKTILGTTPLDSTWVENPFVSPDDRMQFSKNRALIRAFLASQGGRSGKGNLTGNPAPESSKAADSSGGEHSGGCGRQAGGPIAGDLSYALGGGGVALLGLILRRRKY